MKYPSTKRADLLEATKRNEMILETAQQIQKDFAEFGLTIHFSGKAAFFYTELFDQMKVHIDELLTSNQAQFMHLMYRIDIHEQEIAQYEQEMPDHSYVEVITELVIHREIKKVITRDFFRKQTQQNDNKNLLNQ